MENENNGSGNSSLALPFILGGVVGAALAVLYAPWEGRQTRSKLKEMAAEVKEKTNQISNNLKEKASHFMGKGKDVEEQKVEALSAQLEACTNKAEVEIDSSMITAGY